MQVLERTPVTSDRTASPLWARFVQLLLGLGLYGGSLAFMVRARLGLAPWDVLHQGLSKHTGLSIGTWSVLVSIVVLLMWIPLRQMPGVGTILNAILVGVSLNLVLEVLPDAHGLPLRITYLLGGVLANGVATGAYIGAGLGPGPRDGLMTGIARRGHSVRVVRTTLEVTVVAAGFLLGGRVGVGTLVYALSIGPIVHVTIPALWRGRPEDVPRRGDPRAVRPEGEPGAPRLG
jgi:uncharacterized membrane protein YczE